jgi:acetyltransferase-like isoleucine patch superfamily enzyme
MPLEYLDASSRTELESPVEGRILIHGERNLVRIGHNVTFKGVLWLQGHGAHIEIGDGCVIDGVIRTVRGEGGEIRIGAGTSINAAALTMHEPGRIVIGRDCMFSTDIHMDVSDMHPIFDRRTGRRINPARDILIGEHVWLGARVLVLKGAQIGDGAIIGAGSMVSGRIPPNTLAIGTPAKVVRRAVEWRRDFGEMITPAPHGG